MRCTRRLLSLIGLVGSLSLGVAALACSAAAENDSASAGTAATEGHYIQANSPYFWAASSYGAFTDNTQYTGQAGLPVPLADDDAIAVRLQAWLDRFDAIVRKEMTERFHAPLAAPKPIIEILPSASTYNAWVSGVLACVGPAPTASGTMNPADLFLASENSIAPAPGYGCVTPPGWGDVQAFTKLWNGARARCKLSTSSEAVSTYDFSGADCHGAGSYTGTPAIVAASQYIHISTDYIAANTETSIATTLAHELSHYYRSHAASLSARKYDFWYDTDPNAPRRPVPADEAGALLAAYADIVSGPTPVAEKSVKSNYSPRLRRLLTSIAPQLAYTTACTEAVAAYGDGAWVAQLLVNGAVPDDATRDQFLQYESQLVACGGNVTIRTGGADGSLPLENIEQMMDYRALGSPRLEEGITLQNALGRLNDIAAKLDDKAKAFLEKVQANRIGLYTTEQEADEMGLDIATKAGIEPQAVIDAWVDEMRAIDHMFGTLYGAEYWASYQASTGDLDAESCKKLLDAGFMTTDESGQPKPHVVVIGQLDEPHHGSCYRLYNLWREQKAHGYVAGPAPAPLSPPWSEIQAEAARITAAAATPAPTPADGGAP